MTAGEQIKKKKSYLLTSTGVELVFFLFLKQSTPGYSRMGKFLFQANFFSPSSPFSFSVSLLPGTPVLPIHSDVRGSENAGE